MNKIIAERYELIDIIGQGGMADVYLANDTILNRTNCYQDITYIFSERSNLYCKISKRSFSSSCAFT